MQMQSQLEELIEALETDNSQRWAAASAAEGKTMPQVYALRVAIQV